MKIFISWSEKDGSSKAVAEELREWLPDIFDRAVEPWMSGVDIKSGMWRVAIEEALSNAEFCIICIGVKSKDAPWVLFEAGFAARALADIFPYLIGISAQDIIHSPLYAYQAQSADETGTWKLIRAINGKLKDAGLSEEQLKKKFDRDWLYLQHRFDGLLQAASPPTAVAADAAEPILETKSPEPVTDKGRAPHKLWLFNTSFYPRKGHVAHPWQPIYDATGIPPNKVVVRDEKGHELPSQVDFFEKGDPTQPTLLFSLLDEIPATDEDWVPLSFVTIERGEPNPSAGHPRVSVEGPKPEERRVWLTGDRLKVRFELHPEPYVATPPKNFYSGAVTSVLLDGDEILDEYGAQWEEADIEKRCMQIDRLRLLHPDGKAIPHERPDLIGSQYRLISNSSGPVRAVVTVATPLFSYEQPGQSDPRKRFRLYRTISLYKGANYLTEELKVYGTRGIGHPNDGLEGFHFQTRYFSYMVMGLPNSVLSVTAKQPKYFSVSNKWDLPYQGYGFAAGVELSDIQKPHAEFPAKKQQEEQNTFSWRMSHCREPTCLHLFMRSIPKRLELDLETRRIWHEVIDEPLIAKSSY